MSTRATYEFKDEHQSFTVYKHCDGYPSAALPAIANGVDHAWQLPRFEADEFAAAFVAGNKPSFEQAKARVTWDYDRRTHGGNVYLTTSRDDHGDTEFHYVTTCRDGALYVQCFRARRNYKTDACYWDLFAEGPLSQLLEKVPGTPDDDDDE